MQSEAVYVNVSLYQHHLSEYHSCDTFSKKGPGSFGVVTDLYIKPFSNDDYKNTVNVQVEWLYNKQSMKEIVDIWTNFQSDPQYINYHDTDLLIHLQPDLIKGQHTISLLFIWFDDINDRSYDDFGRDYFLNAFLDGVERKPILINETRGMPSELIGTTLSDTTKIAPLAYDARQNGVSNADYWTPQFIQQFVDDVTELIDYADTFKTVNAIIYLEDYGGRFYSNDPNKELSAIPYRNLKMSILTTIYYDGDEAENYVKTWNKYKFENYIVKYWHNEDYRFLMTTFGDLNMTKEGQNLNYYQDKSVYDKLSNIKYQIDQNNLFSNKFTLLPIAN